MRRFGYVLSRAAPLDVGLDEALAVDIDEAVPLLPRLAGKGDEPLDERAAGPAALLRGRRSLEDDDVATRRGAEAVD